MNCDFKRCIVLSNPNCMTVGSIKLPSGKITVRGSIEEQENYAGTLSKSVTFFFRDNNGLHREIHIPKANRADFDIDLTKFV